MEQSVIRFFSFNLVVMKFGCHFSLFVTNQNLIPIDCCDDDAVAYACTNAAVNSTNNPRSMLKCVLDSRIDCKISSACSYNFHAYIHTLNADVARRRKHKIVCFPRTCVMVIVCWWYYWCSCCVALLCLFFFFFNLSVPLFCRLIAIRCTKKKQFQMKSCFVSIFFERFKKTKAYTTTERRINNKTKPVSVWCLIFPLRQQKRTIACKMVSTLSPCKQFVIVLSITLANILSRRRRRFLFSCDTIFPICCVCVLFYFGCCLLLCVFAKLSLARCKMNDFVLIWILAQSHRFPSLICFVFHYCWFHHFSSGLFR